MFELAGRIVGDGTHWAFTLNQAVANADTAAARMEIIMAHAARGIDLALSAAWRGMTKLADESLKAWMETEDTLVSLQSVIESSGGDVEALTKDYQSFASAVQSVTTMGDDAVLSILQTAEAFGISGDAAKKAAKDAISIAAINDSNAASMIRLTARMAEGDVKGAMVFARMVPQLRGVKDGLEFVEKYQQLVDSGWVTAGRRAETLSGQLKQLENDWGDLQERMGETLAVGVLPTVKGLRELTFALQDSESAFRSFVAGFTLGSSEIFLSALEGWNALFDTMERARDMRNGGNIQLDIELNAPNLDEFGKKISDGVVGNMAAGIGTLLNQFRLENAIGGQVAAIDPLRPFEPWHRDNFSNLDRPTMEQMREAMSGRVFSGLSDEQMKAAYERAFPSPVVHGLIPMMRGLQGIGQLPAAPSDSGLAGAMNVLMRNPTIANQMGIGGAFGRLGNVFEPEEERAPQRTSMFRSNLQEEERQFLALQAGRRGGPEEQTAQGVQQLVNVNQEMLNIAREQRNNGHQMLQAANF